MSGPLHLLSAQVATLELERDQLAGLLTHLTTVEAERDELLRTQIQALPEPATREIYRRGYRAGYSAARRCTQKRGPYTRTRALTAGDTP